jgi:hypothetical protein
LPVILSWIEKPAPIFLKGEFSKWIFWKAYLDLTIADAVMEVDSSKMETTMMMTMMIMTIITIPISPM